MANIEIENAITALPPGLSVTPSLDEEATLQADAILARLQPELHQGIHTVASTVLESVLEVLPSIENEKIQISKDQLRGCLAAAAIRSSVVTSMAIGTNLSVAQRLNEQLSITQSADDATSSE